jgi:hypothetical protein
LNKWQLNRFFISSKKSPNKIKNNRKNKANQNASGNWKIKSEIFSFNVNIARQFSKIGNFSNKGKN